MSNQIWAISSPMDHRSITRPASMRPFFSCTARSMATSLNDHSKHMLDALKGAGDSADLLEFDGPDHQLDDSDARTTMLTRIGELLDAQIGH